MTHHLLPTALCATAIAFGMSGVAGAAPDDGYWDIEAYDDCIQNTTKPSWQCCLDSGGVPTLPEDPNGCIAPPGEGQGSPLGPGLPGANIGDPSVAPPPAEPPVLLPPTVPVGPVMG